MILEERVEVLTSAILMKERIIPYHRYSSLDRLLRVIAYILRFSYNVKADARERKKGGVSTLERANASIVLIRIVQSEEFEADIKEVYEATFEENSRCVTHDR